MIYFVQSEKGYIKIGTTERMRNRMKQLQGVHRQALTLMGIMDGDSNTESGLHRQFRRHNVANEWFEPGADLLEFIRANARNWQESDDPPIEEAKLVDYNTVPVRAKRTRVRPSGPLADALIRQGFVRIDIGRAAMYLGDRLGRPFPTQSLSILLSRDTYPDHVRLELAEALDIDPTELGGTA